MRRYWLHWSPQSLRRNANVCSYERSLLFSKHTHTRAQHTHKDMQLTYTCTSSSPNPQMCSLALLRLVGIVVLQSSPAGFQTFSAIIPSFTHNMKLSWPDTSLTHTHTLRAHSVRCESAYCPTSTSECGHRPTTSVLSQHYQ